VEGKGDKTSETE